MSPWGRSAVFGSRLGLGGRAGRLASLRSLTGLGAVAEERRLVSTEDALRLWPGLGAASVWFASEQGRGVLFLLLGEGLEEGEQLHGQQGFGGGGGGHGLEGVEVL